MFSQFPSLDDDTPLIHGFEKTSSLIPWFSSGHSSGVCTSLFIPRFFMGGFKPWKSGRQVSKHFKGGSVTFIGDSDDLRFIGTAKGQATFAVRLKQLGQENAEGERTRRPQAASPTCHDFVFMIIHIFVHSAKGG